MRLTTDRRYRFSFPPEEFWTRIGHVDQFQSWWPWLRSFDGEHLRTGDVWSCAVQPPVPYMVRFTIALDDVVPGRSIAARVSGDITGWATLTVEPDGRGSCVRLISDLQPDKQSLRVMSVVARPVARFGHNWILDVGVRQFGDRAAPATGQDS